MTVINFANNVNIVDNKVYSYKTHVATIDSNTRTLHVHGYWSKTTSKHVNMVAKEYGLNKVDSEIPKEEETNMIRLAGMISQMTALLATDDDKAALLEQQKRYFIAAGASFPDDWDELPIEEKERRLNKVIELSHE